jgi:hypothetical protein
MKWIYAAFWVFVGGMLLWQFANYNHHIDQAVAAAGPQQQHFYFNSKTTNTTGVSATPDGASIKQVDFRVDREQPVSGSFTCHIVLKNIGNKKATGIIVRVSPFRGIPTADAEDSRTKPTTLPDSDPAAQITQWIDFPDMAPGQIVTKDAVFMNNYQYNPGSNPNPEIKFQTVP